MVGWGERGRFMPIDAVVLEEVLDTLGNEGR